MIRSARPLRLGVFVVALALAAILGLLGWRMTGQRSGADFEDPALVGLGRAIYDQQCARCHGVNLEGQPNWKSRLPNGKLPAPPHDATGHTWHHPDDILFGITKFGLGPYAPPGYESDMPAFGPLLSDEQIWAAIAYIKSRWPAEIRRRQAEITEKSQTQ